MFDPVKCRHFVCDLQFVECGTCAWYGESEKVMKTWTAHENRIVDSTWNSFENYFSQFLPSNAVSFEIQMTTIENDWFLFSSIFFCVHFVMCGGGGDDVLLTVPHSVYTHHTTNDEVNGTHIAIVAHILPQRVINWWYVLRVFALQLKNKRKFQFSPRRKCRRGKRQK